MDDDEPDDDGPDDDEMIDVDLTWPPERIREFCENENNNWWTLYLPKDWTSADIEQLYLRHAAIPDPYEGVICEIAGDTRTPVHILVEIKARFAHLVPAVMSSLALNPQTPIEFVEELAQHADETVREHALQSLQRRKAT